MKSTKKTVFINKTEFLLIKRGNFHLLNEKNVILCTKTERFCNVFRVGEKDSMLATLVMLVSIFIGQVEGILVKKYNMKHNVGGFIFIGLVSLFSAIFFIIIDNDGLCFPREIWIYGIISGVMYCVASILTFVALGCGPYALSMIILSYSLVFSIGYGLIFLDEPANVFTYIGIFAILASMYLTRPNKTDKEAKVTVVWFVSVMLSVISAGMFGVIKKIQQLKFDNAYNNEYMIITVVFSAIVLIVVGIIKDRKKLPYIMKYGSIYALGAGLSNGALNMMGLVVNNLMPLSISSPLSSGLKIIVVFFISKIIFKEQFLKRQLAGVLLSIAAMIVINL